MKKIKFILLTILTIALMTSCSSNSTVQSDNDKISIVCTSFPQYDWVKEIVGTNIDKFDITILQDSGVDLHSYQPTTDDIIKISNCDMFIYVGGQSDQWVDSVLKSAGNDKMIIINMMEVLGDSVKVEEIVEGMQEEDHKDEKEDEEEYDEHIWLSINNAITLSEYIQFNIASLDRDNEQLYIENLSKFISNLISLDQKYSMTLQDKKFDTLVFGDRFPFRYLTDDYDLNYYAAFSGCSSESEASFETIVFLSKKVDELGLNYVFAIEGSNQKIAETIIKNTKNKDQKIATLNSMQSITKDDIAKGANYITIMEENLEVLKTTLN